MRNVIFTSYFLFMSVRLAPTNLNKGNGWDCVQIPFLLSIFSVFGYNSHSILMETCVCIFIINISCIFLCTHIFQNRPQWDILQSKLLSLKYGLKNRNYIVQRDSNVCAHTVLFRY